MEPLCRQQNFFQSNLSITKHKVCEQCQKQTLVSEGFSLFQFTTKSLPTSLAKLWPKSVLKYTGPDRSFAR